MHLPKSRAKPPLNDILNYDSNDANKPFHTKSLALPLDSAYFARNISSYVASTPMAIRLNLHCTKTEKLTRS